MPEYIRTGFQDLDKKIGGFKRGDLTIIGARPAMGKSTFAINLAQNVTSNQNGVLFFSFELPNNELTDRLISCMSDVDGWKIRTGNLKDIDVKKMEHTINELKALPLYVVDDYNLVTSDLEKRIRKEAEEHNIEMVIVDYIQLIMDKTKCGRTEWVEKTLDTLSRLANELNITVVALMMLPRGVNDPMDPHPNMKTFREGAWDADIERYADTILCLHRPDYYRQSEEHFMPTNIVELTIREGDGDKDKPIELYFHPEYLRFMDKPAT